MINLIPNEEKKKMATNFYYRFVVLSFLMLSMAMIFAIFAISPYYIMARAKDHLVNETFAVPTTEPVPVLDQNTLHAIEELDTKLSLVENAKGDKFVVSKRIINEIIKSKVSEIKIDSISYDNDVSLGAHIGIDGTAPSREVLLSFRRALESNDNFQNVDLPISNFVTGSNIQFYLTLIPK